MADIAYVKNLAVIEILNKKTFEGQFWATFGEFTFSLSFLRVPNGTPL